MFAKRLVLAAVCAATLFTGDLMIAPEALAAGAAAGSVASGALAGVTTAQQQVEPAAYYYRRSYRPYRRCWVRTWRDRWGYLHRRRICR